MPPDLELIEDGIINYGIARSDETAFLEIYSVSLQERLDAAEEEERRNPGLLIDHQNLMPN